jgi:ribosomal protein L11 methyltransferase
MMLDFVLEVTYRSDAEIDDKVQARLFLSASTGSSSIDRDGETTVTAYFDSTTSRAAAMAALGDLGTELRTDDRARVDWLERYEQSLEPLFIGEKFVVAPDERLIGETERLRIIVPQEQAFGTGSHETTSLCIEMLEHIDLRGRRGLDIGSGSGILAIAMLRLGAGKVIAFDNDIDAFGPLRDNRLRNRAAFSMFIGSVEALRRGMFDVITMNIVPEVIIPQLPAVIALMSGELILSGILTTRRDDVVRAAATLPLAGESSKGEWWCGRFQRPVA